MENSKKWSQSLMRDGHFNCKDFTWKVSVVWMHVVVRSWEVVACIIVLCNWCD